MSQILKPKKGYKKVKGLFGKFEEIPEEWKVLEFQDIAKVKRGASPRPIEDPKYFGQGRGWIRISDISKSNKYLKKTRDYLSKLGESKSVAVNDGDIILSVAATVGKPIIVKMRACIHDGFVTFSNLSNEMNNEFLYYMLIKIENRFTGIGQHGTQSNINAELVSKMKFNYPPLQEQQIITSILSHVDDFISSTQKVIDQTKFLKKGLMQKLLTKGIGHTKFKKINFGRYFIDYEIPEEWELSTLNNFATVHGRIGWKNLRSNEYLESGFLMLSVWSLVETSSYGIDFTKGVKRLSQFRYDESPEIQLQNGDVLIAKDGDIGRIGFIKNLPEPATVNSHVVPVRVNNTSLNPEFLYWFFKSKPFQTYCKSFTSGTTIPLFTQKDLRNCVIPIPKKEEQNRIIVILSNIDSAIISQIQSKEKLEKLKKSLMQKLLTGQVRVKI